MKRAIDLALMGKGFTNPNPLVGAVIVRDDKIIGEGYHHKYGDLHAERDALKNAYDNGVDVSGATMFVTLEPCCHHGKQPPCTDAIIKSGISKVVIASRDPNPLVNGKGTKILKNAGLKVISDFMKEEADLINDVFFHFIKTKRPYVILKYAMTLDGMTSTSKGFSKWITGENARKNVHQTRSDVMAIMCGINTILNDNPTLNVRLNDNKKHRQPIRIILDSTLKIDLNCNIIKTYNNKNCGKVMIFCAENLSDEQKLKKSLLINMGIDVLEVPLKDNHLDLEKILDTLGNLNIDSILVESGGKLNASFLFNKNGCLANEVHCYIAPKIFGNDGININSPVKGRGCDLVENCIKFSKPEIKFFDEDILLKYKISF